MRYKVTLAYDGSNYHGWQTQRKGNSIEEKIEEALYRIHHREVRIVGSGRTDARVHAKGQVFHFDSPLHLEAASMRTALNVQLSCDIRVQHVELVDAHFHARFDACAKRYDFYLSSDVDNPFLRSYMAFERAKLDVDKMREAACFFIGEHDFTSFTSAKIDDRKDRIRHITRLDIQQTNQCTHFILEGNSFLRYMVRMIVQTLIMVGKNKLKVDEVKTMLLAKNKHACQYKADPQGLYLTSVTYKKTRDDKD
ncbi:MAG: tRNA pseudouridine(38-40) synthase TruA [Breznakia sp.]